MGLKPNDPYNVDPTDIVWRLRFDFGLARRTRPFLLVTDVWGDHRETPFPLPPSVWPESPWAR